MRKRRNPIFTTDEFGSLLKFGLGLSVAGYLAYKLFNHATRIKTKEELDYEYKLAMEYAKLTGPTSQEEKNKARAEIHLLEQCYDRGNLTILECEGYPKRPPSTGPLIP